MLSRRQFINSFALAAAYAKFAPGDLSAFAGTVELHIKIAEKVKQLGSSGKTPLKILYPKGSLANITPVVAEFKRLTNREVQLIEGSLDEISSEIVLNKHVSSLAKNFDIALPSTFSIPDLAEANSLLDLTILRDKYSELLPDQGLYPNGNGYLNRLYGFQTDGDVYLMFYNQNFFKHPVWSKEYVQKFGQDLELPKTWDELDRQVRFFHRPHAGYYGGNLYRNLNYSIWEFWMRMHAKGVLPFASDMSSRVHEEPAVEALNELVELTKYLSPSVLKDGLFENFQSFSEGKSFCNLGWGGTQKFLEGNASKIKGQTLIDLPPGGVVNGQHFRTPFFNWGWNYVVSGQSTQSEAAFLFCLFAVTPKISTLAVREGDGYFDPFLVEHYNDTKIRSLYTDKFLVPHKKAMEQCIPDLYLKGQGLYLSALKQGVHIAIQGHAPSKIALKKVSEKWDRITESLGRSLQVSSWQKVRESYPSDIKRALRL